VTATAEQTYAMAVPVVVTEGGQQIQRTPMDMLHMAVSRGDTQLAEKLMDLTERWQKSQARRAFDEAIGAAKAEIPVIAKNREVDFTSTKGRTHYRHEDLAEIARTVDPILAKFGLSYRFRVSSAVNEPVSVTCILSHRDGHSEETTLHAGRDESGNKNSIQGIGSTITYLQRYTLKAALGLAAAQDDDAKSATDAGTISEAQLDDLRTKVTDYGAIPAKIAAFAKVERLEDIPAKDFKRVVDALEAWARQQKAGK
jgi:hypothetical protein